MVAERLLASNPVTYATKRDTLRTSTYTFIQNLKSFSSESVASSSQKHDYLEERLTFVAAKQEEMDVQLKSVIVRQDDMGYDLKEIMELLKQKP